MVERRWLEDHCRIHQIDTADTGVAVGPQVVRDNVAAVGPGDEGGPLEACLIDYRGDIVGPQLPVGIVLRPGGLLRQTVPAKVEGDDTEGVRDRCVPGSASTDRSVTSRE
jgi:hypothetical protein